MKKQILLFIFTYLPIVVSDQGIQKGYHGFADVGYCHYISQTDPSTFEVTTSHGYQFNPYIFLGAGVGFDFTGKAEWGDVSGMPYKKRDSKVDIPIFFNARANITKTRICPFVDARVGAYVNNEGGIYANLAVGGRYEVDKNKGVSVSFGYELRKVTVQELRLVPGSKYNGYSSEYYYKDRTGENVDGFVFKVGFDF